MNHKEFSYLFEFFKSVKNLKNVSIAMTNEYRKHEYIFGITVFYEDGNFKMQDYCNLCFNDLDKNEVDISDIKQLIVDFNGILATFNQVLDEKLFYIELEELQNE